jgi:signal peptidase I
MFNVFQRRARPSESGSADRAARPHGVLAEIAEVLLLAVGLYLVINFVIQTVHVIGLSMYPTVGNGDYLVATKIDYRLHDPQRGDIVILKDPITDPTNPQAPPPDFIKRVIGVPGDHVLIRNGRTFINGHLVEEPYVSPEPWTLYNNWPASPTGDPQGVLLGPGQYFVMGDNRNHSQDSRFFGPIPRSDIEAHVWIRVLPLSRFGTFDSHPTIEPQVTVPAAA